jgi:hypothetical protein
LAVTYYRVYPIFEGDAGKGTTWQRVTLRGVNL